MPGKREPEDERRHQILRAALRVATRERLDQLTIRQVAAEAGISPGLVFFYYTNKEVLLIELLRWLLEHTLMLEIPPETWAYESPTDRLLALIRQEIGRVMAGHPLLELIFEYWVVASQDTEPHTLIRAALDRYREAFQVFVEAVMREAPQRFVGLTPEGFSMLVVSLIQGYTIQVIKDPTQTDAEPLMQAITAVLGSPMVLE